MNKEQLTEIISNCKKIITTNADIKELQNQIPQYSWILLLKLFDYYEKDRKLLDKNFVSGIPEKFQWNNWTNDAGDNSLTGKSLENFVDDELLPALGALKLEPGAESRKVISYAFTNFKQRLPGTAIRLIIEEIDKIKFDNETISILRDIYTSELLDWANNAEKYAYFFTPRPICKFIVSVIKPNFKNNEKIFDPACGLGGFLLESYHYMKNDKKQTDDTKKLEYFSLVGQDKDANYYLCCALNMMLNEIKTLNISKLNSLERSTDDIPPEGEYEIVMSNPSFNEKEKKTIADNLPLDVRTSKTALHFLYLAMEELKDKGRGAIIVPSTVLFLHGKTDNLKLKLLEKFNLHTIVQLPKSIFAPRTGIDTFILFFEKGTPTKEIWFYDLPLPKRLESDDPKKKTKTLSFSKNKPVLDEDFAEALKWFEHKVENDYAWKVSVDELKTENDGKIEVNLDIKNPNIVDEPIELSPHELIDTILNDEEKTLELLRDVKELIQKEIPK